MLRPSPMPSPTSFVVKKGSKILSRCSASMPGPLSRIDSRLRPFSTRPWMQMVGCSPSKVLCFRSEEGIKNLVEVLGFNARAVVTDRQQAAAVFDPAVDANGRLLAVEGLVLPI